MFNARHLIAALALAPLVAVAAMSDTEATQAVQGALADGQSANSVIQMLRDDGRGLSDATQLAVAAAPGDNQPALIRAGICAARDITEAGQVGNDLLAEVGEEMADTVQGMIATYDTGGCDDDDDRIKPPPSYAPTATSNNGGTNPQFPGSPSN